MKGSILFNKDINIEVDVDPAADEGAKLTSAVNLVDGQELGVGGSDLPEVTAADNGKVLAVNASGEWAVENRNGICIDTEGTLDKSYNDLVSMVHSGILPFVYFEEDGIGILPLNALVGGETYEATFLTANGVSVIYSAEDATSPLVSQD